MFTKTPDRALWCARCRKPLREALYVEHTVANGYDLERDQRRVLRALLHIRCALDLVPQTVRNDLTSPLLDASTREELASACAAIFNRIDGLASEHDAPDARDPRGYPSVRVLFGGSAWRTREPFRFAVQRALPAPVLPSPTREYRIDDRELRGDPAVPLVGAVFAARVGTRESAAQKSTLVAWRALELPAPVLWLVRDAGTPERELERKELEVRTLLESVGFDGNTSRVLGVDRVDGAALRALADALDEALPRGRARQTRESPAIRAAKSSHNLALEGRTDGLAEALYAAHAHELRDPTARDLVGRAAARALELEVEPSAPLRLAALEVLASAPHEDAIGPLVRLIDRELDRPGRTSALLQRALVVLAQLDRTLLTELGLRALARAESDAAFTRVTTLLARTTPRARTLVREANLAMPATRRAQLERTFTQR